MPLFLHENTIYCIFVVKFASLLSQPAKLEFRKPQLNGTVVERYTENSTIAEIKQSINTHAKVNKTIH